VGAHRLPGGALILSLRQWGYAGLPALLPGDPRQALPSLGQIGQWRTAWMNVRSLYLADDGPMVPGHAIYAGSR
jgi:hypothetical protein